MLSCGEHIVAKPNTKTTQLTAYRNAMAALFHYHQCVATIMITSNVLLKDDAKIQEVTYNFTKYMDIILRDINYATITPIFILFNNTYYKYYQRRMSK